MFKFTIETEQGWPVVVKYDVHGKHIPATQYDPEEFPELEVCSVMLFDKYEIMGDLDEGDMAWIYDEADANLIEQAEAMEAEKAEALYEQQRDRELLAV